MRTNHRRTLLGGLFVLCLIAALSPMSVAAHDPASLAPDRTAPWIAAGGAEDEDTPPDPARNIALPCELQTLPATPDGRSKHRITHVANRCGFVGTDIEFQSRVHVHAGGVRHTHDYAFLGTMGGGMRIFDITDPADPRPAGAYGTQAWQNDVQVRGNVALLTFDGVAGEPSTTSDCMQLNHPSANGQGIELIRLNYDSSTALFTTGLLACVPNPPGGAHTATIDPTGRFVYISNCCSDWAVDVIDIRSAATVGAANGDTLHKYRLLDENRNLATRCPSGVSFRCIVMTRSWGVAKGSTIPAANSARGLWDPHDLHFSADGKTIYVAAIESTWIVDVANLFASTPLNQKVRTVSIIPNILVPNPTCASGGGDPTCDPRNLTISHQADVTSDGKILVVSDERGGGLDNTGCNEDPYGMLGGLHFFALAPISGVPASAGASPTTPKILGHYFNPNPGLLSESSLFPPELITAMNAILAQFPRAERGCTAHVFRLGGNGTSSPGSGTNGFNGVSTMPKYRLTEGWYGAGTWQVDFSRPSSNTDGVAEDPRSSWGNTLGWNIQPGADTWSAKEYKGFIYTGDMLRGMDVFQSVGGRDPVVLLSKTGPASATAGTVVTYKLTYRNVGPAASGHGRIVDGLPRGTSFYSATGGGRYDSTTRKITWSFGTVPVGGTGSVYLRVRIAASAAAGTTVTNRADFYGDATVSPPAYARTVVTR